MNKLVFATLASFLLSCNPETYTVEGSWILESHVKQTDTSVIDLAPGLAQSDFHSYQFTQNSGSNFSDVIITEQVFGMGTTTILTNIKQYKNWNEGLIAFSQNGIDSIRAFEVVELNATKLELKLETSEFSEEMRFRR